MAGFYSAEPIPDSITLQQMGTGILAPSVGEVQGAVAGGAIAGLPTPRILEQGAASLEREGIPQDVPFQWPGEATAPLPPLIPRTLLQPDVANQKYGVEGSLKFDAPVDEATAQLLHDQHLAAVKRQDILNRNEGTQFGTGLVTRFLPSLAISALDPLNVAAAFVPVLGEARYAELLAAAGENVFARAGIRAAVGAAQGVAGTALLQPIEYGLSRAEMNDYTMTDALASIAMGGVLGGGLHVIGGAIGDRYANPLTQRLEDAGPEARDTLLRSAVAQHLEDRPVDVGAALEAHELANVDAELARTQRQVETSAPPPRGEVPPVGIEEEPARGVGAQVVGPEGVPRLTIEKGQNVFDILREVRRQAEAAGGPVLPDLPRRVYAAVETATSDVGGPEAQGQLSELRRRLFEKGETPETALQGVWGKNLVDAPPGLQQAIARDLVVQGVSPEIPAPGTPRPAEAIRQQLLETQRTPPGVRDPVAAREADALARDVPVNTDEAAANKMLADAEAEIEALRQDGKLPPEVEQDLRTSEETAAKDQGTANALQEAGNCLAEGLLK